MRLAKAEDADAAFKELKGLVQPTGDLIRGLGGTDLDVRKAEGGVIAITPTEAGLQHRITDAISAAIETVRRRVDFTGTTEAQIVRQGSDRILVQVPGLQDTAPLKELIGKTARLTFHEVNPTISAEEAKKTRPPTGYRVYPGSDREEGDQLLRETPGGARRRAEERAGRFRPADPRADHRLHLQRLGRAQVRRVHQDARRPPVRHRARRQGDLRPCHSRRRSSAAPARSAAASRSRPPTSSPSSCARARCRPSSPSSRSAWWAPASARTSIEAGKLAALIGGIAVASFMIFAYGLLGVFAVVGAAIHVLFVLAIMAVIGSTMTLPGIAGIVLTIGMAVDANVLINERIREELRNGRTPISAIETGFTRAYGTIIDSQLTTFIAGLVMFWLGSGPIRGFAVTLTLGIMTTVYTAFTIARLLVVWWLAAQKKGRKVEAPLAFTPGHQNIEQARP